MVRFSIHDTCHCMKTCFPRCGLEVSADTLHGSLDTAENRRREPLHSRCGCGHEPSETVARRVTSMIATTSKWCLDSYSVEERRLSVEGHEGDRVVNTKPSVSIRQVPGRPAIHTSSEAQI